MIAVNHVPGQICKRCTRTVPSAQQLSLKGEFHLRPDPCNNALPKYQSLLP